MNQTAFKHVQFPLDALVSDIALGQNGLPDIQRPFVWPNTKIRDLFDSMYKGHPVGYLLLWETESGASRKTIGTNAKQLAPNLVIVDGQQRLTSLYAVVKGISVIRGITGQSAFALRLIRLKKSSKSPALQSNGTGPLFPTSRSCGVAKATCFKWWETFSRDCARSGMCPMRK